MSRRINRRQRNLLTPEVTPEVEAAIAFAVEHLTKRAVLGHLAPQVGTVAERRVTYLRCMKVSRRTIMDGRPRDSLLVHLDPVMECEPGSDVLAGIGHIMDRAKAAIADDADRDDFVMEFRRRKRKGDIDECDCCGAEVEVAEDELPLNRILEYSDDKALDVIKWAEDGDEIAQDVLRSIVRDILALGLALPPNLAAHVSAVYCKEKPLPMQKRDRTLSQREWEMAWAVHLVVGFGDFHAYRRRSPIGRPGASAQWIVAEALKQLHIRSRRDIEREVEDAWVKHKDTISILGDLKDWQVASIDGHVLWSFSPLNT